MYVTYSHCSVIILTTDTELFAMLERLKLKIQKLIKDLSKIMDNRE